MGVAERYSIAYKGLKNGLHEFDFKVGGALFEAYGNTEIKDGACDVHVSMNRAEGMLELHTVIAGTVTTACDRCLEDCDVPIHFDGNLLVKFSDATDEYDGEVMWISPSEGELNLTQYIYESIVLSLPYLRVHPDGQCDPEMLARFNIVSDAEFAAIEARAQAEAASAEKEQQAGDWGKLEALREQMACETEEALRGDGNHKKVKK